MKNKTAGFTLIEIVIAVAIIAILTTIAYPSYQSSVQKSHRAQAKADLLALTQQLERWYTVNNTYATFSSGTIAVDSPSTGTPYYNLSYPTATPVTATTYTLQAVPIATSMQATDICGTLTIAHTGAKTFDGASGTVDQCW